MTKKLSRKKKTFAEDAGPDTSLEERRQLQRILGEYPPGMLPAQCRFLDAYKQTGILTKAARTAGVGKRIHFVWLQKSVVYREQFERVKDVYADMLEAKIMEHALFGVREPVYHQGQIVGHVQRYDHKLMLQMLRKFRPEYDYVAKPENKRQLMAPTGNEVVIHVAGDAAFSIDDRRARLLAIIDQERERRAAIGDAGAANGHAPVNGNGHHGNGQNGNGKH